MGKDFSDTEVTKFNDATLSEEDVLTFEISVEDLSVVNMFETETYLSKPLEYLVFREVSSALFFDFSL